MDAPNLTRMETKVARLVSLSCPTRQIAAILGIAEKTAANHRWQAMKKLGVHTMAALTRAVIVHGISSLNARLTDEELKKLASAHFEPSSPEAEVVDDAGQYEELAPPLTTYSAPTGSNRQPG